MEMKEVRRIEINVHKKDTQVVKVQYLPDNEDVLAADMLYDRLYEQLGLNNSSRRYFTLTHGAADKPETRMKTSDTLTLPIQGKLWLHKCVYDDAEEVAVLSDPVALHLICEEARQRILNGELKPTPPQSAQLEDAYGLGPQSNGAGMLKIYLYSTVEDYMSDPKFCMEEAYVKLCHSLDNYFTVPFPNAVLCSDYDKPIAKRDSCYINTCFEEDEDSKWLPPVQLTKNTVIDLTVTKRGLQLCTVSENADYFVLWKHIISWTHTTTTTKNRGEEAVKPELLSSAAESASLSFCVMCRSGANCVLDITTPQLPYLAAVLMEIIRAVQIRLKDKPVFLAEMVRKTDAATTWDNALYNCEELSNDSMRGTDLREG